MSDVTFTIDGCEVTAPAGTMLVDAAKLAGITIPVFCYEPKIGPPVGACRMCLVEIEGMPKLQTGCSTPVKDGMVVYTKADKVKQGQNAVVEFILANHPLDCPVCDKGGECPLQDNAMGWGAGVSRFTEPKRHFVKPIELSPLIAIDRERCILCYKCVRFSQEVSEDYQLTFMGRGDNTFVGTFDDSPYLAPFSGNIIELCPVGALTSIPYRFKARPWEVERVASLCTLCPSQCNVEFTVRDDRVVRVLSRDNRKVDGGWLCDKGRFGYQSIDAQERLTVPLVRVEGELVEVSWDEALERIAAGLSAAGSRSAATVGGETTNEEGYLIQRLFRDALNSPHIDSRRAGPLDVQAARLLNNPKLSVSNAQVETADVVFVVGADPVNQMPTIDLRIRKARRRNGAQIAVAASQPTGLDSVAQQRLSYAPGGAEAVLLAVTKAIVEVGARPVQPIDAELVCDYLQQVSLDELCHLADVEIESVEALAKLLMGADRLVIVWPERLASGPRGHAALRALANLALTVGLDAHGDAGLLEVPDGTNSRGLRDVGCLPNLLPGLTDSTEVGMHASEIAAACASGDLKALYLLHCDPLRELPDRELWQRALANSEFTVCHTEFLSEGLMRHADVVLPAEAYAEKEGTLTHPDGRVQRLRPAVGRPGEVRMEWQLLVELSNRLGLLTQYVTLDQVQVATAAAVPFYDGLTLDEIGGEGVRWQERPMASSASGSPSCIEPDRMLPDGPGHPKLPAVRFETVPLLWASPTTERSPALNFMRQMQAAQMAPELAAALGVGADDTVEIVLSGRTVRAPVVLRRMAHPGTVYLAEGALDQPANLIANGPQVVEVHKAREAVVS